MSEPPLIRIVKMTLHPDRTGDFERMFDERSALIRAFVGCLGLDLVRDTRFPNVMTTISVWESEEALERYRKSDLFNETWAQTKAMFVDRPEAASHLLLRRVEPGRVEPDERQALP